MYSASKCVRTIPRFWAVRPSTFRSFSTTFLLRTAESEKPFCNPDVLDKLKRSPTFEKLLGSPDALLTLQKCAKAMEKEGALKLDLVCAQLNHV